MQEIKSLRTCRTCGRKAFTKEDLLYFKKDPGMFYEHDNSCLDCSRKLYREYHQRNRDKLNKDHRDKRKTDPDYWTKWYNKNKQKWITRAKANTKLQITATSKCAMCKTSENLVKHHPDYSKPLEVIILCKACHDKIHRVYGKVIRKYDKVGNKE
jgi:hypothetical protein